MHVTPSGRLGLFMNELAKRSELFIFVPLLPECELEAHDLYQAELDWASC